MNINKKKTKASLSVVIPTYNAAQWLPKTIPRIEKALKVAKVDAAEIIVVDDGSTDGSAETAKKLKIKYPIRIVNQPNSGRFLARAAGVNAATYELILFIDTRVYIEPNGLKFVLGEMAKNPDRKVWTSHVHIDKQANIYARFWDALTCLAWRRYFSNPRDYSYGLKEFDYYPKGTTCFVVPNSIIKEANHWFMTNTKNVKTSSDDTLLIRHIATTNNINISPEFACTYHARTSFWQYNKHVFHRGTFFVDGFLRHDGNRFFWPLIAGLFLSATAPLLFIIFPELFLPSFLIFLVICLALFPVSLFLRIGVKDAWSLTALSPLFAFVYGAGIWAAFLKLYVPPYIWPRG